MKILHIIDKLDVGGAERVLVNQCNLLAENGLKVNVLCLLEEAELDRDLNANISICYLRRIRKFSLSKIIRLFRILRNYDIVHIHSRHVLRYVGLVLFLPRPLRSYKVVYQDHSLLALKKTFKEKFYIDKMIRRVDASVIVSEEQRFFFPKAKRIFLLENIVRKTDEHVILKPERQKLVAVGNFRSIKNYALLLEIVQKLPFNYSCDIYSNNIETHYFSENKLVVDELINQGRLKIIQGEFNIQKQLINYTLAVHTALSESGPLIAVESLSVGLPIIMYNTGAVSKRIKKIIPELIKEDIICDNWVRSIIEYHSNFKKMNVFSNTLYQLYLETYSEENYSEKCLKIYRHIQNS